MNYSRHIKTTSSQGSSEYWNCGEFGSFAGDLVSLQTPQAAPAQVTQDLLIGGMHSPSERGLGSNKKASRIR